MGVVVAFNVLAIVGGLIQVFRDRQPRTVRRVAEIFLVWFFVLGVGLAGLWAFIGHAFFADQVAKSIGWPAGNPFQTEVAVANLAVAVLGIMCYWIRDNFWTATVVATSVWLLGAAVVHVIQIITEGNYSPNNAGLALYLDIFTPLVLVGLLIAYRRGEGTLGARQAARVR